jgi:hypothetical protein
MIQIENSKVENYLKTIYPNCSVKSFVYRDAKADINVYASKNVLI